nr:ATP synthase F0 subunit 8 [Polymesoda caroliniana]WOV69033.1 ATP synthase F0 subunit 8 [Polymesoda caroliniana]
MPQMAPAASLLVFLFSWFVFLCLLILLWWSGKRSYSY